MPQGRTPLAPRLSRLTASTLAADCYQQLKSAILDLSLPPGAPLVEVHLANQLGISKTPVRQALAQLAGEGLIRIEPTGRAFVTGLTAEAIRDIYRVRILLEGGSLREVATKLTEDDLRHLGEVVDRASEAVEANDLVTYNAASQEFHRYLLECASNPLLLAIADRLFDQVSRVRAAIYLAVQDHSYHPSRLHQGHPNHRRILDALIARDAATAVAMLTADLQQLIDVLDSPPLQQVLARLASHD